MELDNKKNKKQEFEGGPFILPEVEVTGEIMPFEFGGVEDWKANIEKYIQQDNKISKQKKAEYLDALSRIDDSQRTLKNFVLWMSSPNTIGPWEGFLTSTKRYHGYFPSDNPIYKPQGEKVWKPPIDPNDNWEYSSEPIITNHPPKNYTEIPTIYEILDKDIKERKDIEKAIEESKEWLNNQEDSIVPDGWQYAKYAKGGLIKKYQGGGAPKHTRAIVSSNVNQVGIPRINPYYDKQYISPAQDNNGQQGYLRITPEDFGAYNEEFVPKSDTEYYNTVNDLYTQGRILGTPADTLPKLNEYTEPPLRINPTWFKLLQKHKWKEEHKDDINGYGRYRFNTNDQYNI